MTGPDEILTTARTALLVDWPSRDVPDTLVRAGYTVAFKGGPAADDFFVLESNDGQMEQRRTGQPPGHADLVYAHRPLSELSDIVAMARQVGAAALWWQSGLDENGRRDPRGCWMPAQDSERARGIAEAAGLRYLDDVYLADALRRLDIPR